MKCIALIKPLMCFYLIAICSAQPAINDRTDNAAEVDRSGHDIFLREEYSGQTEERDYVTITILVDTINYDNYNEFYLWQTIPLFDSWGMAAGDMDHNGLNELYSTHGYGTNSLHVQAYEYEPGSGLVFKTGYQGGSYIPVCAEDFDEDGLGEVIITRPVSYPNGHIQFLRNFEAVHPDSLPSVFNYEYSPGFYGQINNPKVYDLDNDGNRELLMYQEGSDDDEQDVTKVMEYDPITNALVEEYLFYADDFYTSNYAMGDIDEDGHPEFVTGSVHGYVYVIESTGVDQYELVYETQLETYNAYMATMSSDMDGNGKPELWMGGNAHYDGVIETRISCFEATFSNRLEETCRLVFPGISGYTANDLYATDLTGDGEDELVVIFDICVLILKNYGDYDYRLFHAWYHPDDAMGMPEFRASVIKDLDSDGANEVAISTVYIHPEEGAQYYTNILRKSDITSIQAEPRLHWATKMQAYPNPFNSNLQIIVECEASSVIRIFNINGKELFNVGVSESKMIHVTWNGVDNHGREVPAGIYLVRVDVDNESTFKKVMYLK